MQVQLVMDYPIMSLAMLLNNIHCNVILEIYHFEFTLLAHV